jgi:hypothetical protein
MFQALLVQAMSRSPDDPYDHRCKERPNGRAPLAPSYPAAARHDPSVTLTNIETRSRMFAMAREVFYKFADLADCRVFASYFERRLIEERTIELVCGRMHGLHRLPGRSRTAPGTPLT